MSPPDHELPASATTRAARLLMRKSGSASLATSNNGWPFASLANVAFALDGSPLMLLSDLAEHSKNIKANERVSLLFLGACGLSASLSSVDILAAPRLTVMGEARRVDDPSLISRYLARHPEVEGIANFADFHLYRVSVSRVHSIAGFGRITWIEGHDFLCAHDPLLGLAEAGLLDRLNGDENIKRDICAHLPLQAGSACHLTGLDPDGIEVRCAEVFVRLDFATPIAGPSELLQALHLRVAK